MLIIVTADAPRALSQTPAKDDEWFRVTEDELDIKRTICIGRPRTPRWSHPVPMAHSHADQGGYLAIKYLLKLSDESATLVAAAYV